jgi:putative transcriptional regulator
VVRQTVSKWERGLSVPDSEMLISLSETLETPVSTLLGESIAEPEAEDLKAISEKLEVINLQLAQRKETSQKRIHWLFILMCIAILAVFAGLGRINGSYLNWDYHNPELAAAGVLLHGFEWIFVRIAPFILIGLIIGIIFTRKKAED